MKKLIYVLLVFLLILSSCEQLPPSVENKDIFIEGGDFKMGSSKLANEKPLHTVTLNSFYIQRYLVTQKDFKSLMGYNPSKFKGDNNAPVEQVTWFEAVEYANRLSGSKGLKPVYIINGSSVERDKEADGYRLPTEAEWEYAARAGTETEYYWGDKLPTDRTANYNYNVEKTTPVGGYPSNPWGLYDIAGNVFEWMGDWYIADYTKIPNYTDNPSGPGTGTYRVVRGGSWGYSELSLRSAVRDSRKPDLFAEDLGFRLVRNQPPDEELPPPPEE